jgi:hypothetical protein
MVILSNNNKSTGQRLINQFILIFEIRNFSRGVFRFAQGLFATDATDYTDAFVTSCHRKNYLCNLCHLWQIL